MKKSIFMLGMALTASLISCTDDDLGNGIVENPVQTGDEILFGSTLSGDAEVIEKTGQTRTVYGDRTSTGVPVYWEADGSDTIAIFCLQASQPANHLVHYKVAPELDEQGNPTETASTVTKVNTAEAGLQWGNPQEEHRFYAFYPASAVKGSSEENETGMITANIPVTQQVQEWRKGTFSRPNTPFHGKTCYFGLPNMDYAYMYAYNAVTPSQVQEGSMIDLPFKNLVTVLDITVQGPEDEGSSVIVTNINVDAIGDNPDVILTGDFTCNIRAARDEDDGTDNGTDKVTATCTPVPSDEVRNRISIPCYAKNQENEVNKGFIELKSGELLNVKAYIIPQDEKNTVTKQTLRITVSTLNGAANVKTLSTDDVKPHKINRVILPKLNPGGTNYWMSSLDPDIYLTELSIPGSKMSVLTEANGSDIIYQNATIEQQFKDGVRAFILQTQRVYGIFSAKYRLDVYGGKGSVMTLKEALANIASYLKNAYEVEKKTNEFAFVLLTCQDGSGSRKEWFELLQNEINAIKDNSDYRIYTGEITPETTLGDVKGKIVLKANYNDSDMISGNTTNAPMLYTLWETAFVENGVPMTWGNPHNQSNLTWLYQEATAVKIGGNSENNADATKEEKISYITKLFKQSLYNYQHFDAHDTWYFNDLGGYYCNVNDHLIGGPTYDDADPTSLAKDLNEMGVQELQNRTENAGLGLIFMNFADKQKGSGAEYKSDWLIQTLIDNNFKFALRKKTSSGGGEGTKSYNASYSNGGNAVGWDE